MRDKNQNYIEFCRGVEEYVSRKLDLSSFLRPPVVDTPTVPEELVIVYPKKFHQMEALVLIHWFLPDSLKWRIHLDLWTNEFNQFNRKQQIQLRIMLNSKNDCLSWYYETQRISSHEFWGLLGRATRLHLDGYFKVYRIDKPQRKRGYDDKGGMKSEDKWLPRYDFSFTNTQNIIEHDRYLKQKTIHFVLNYFQRRT